MPKVFALSLILSCHSLWAQSARDLPFGDPSMDRQVQQKLFDQWAHQPEAERQAIARQAANEKVREFYAKAQRFVTLWQKFAADLNNQRTFDAKLAKQVSKAFHDLEKSEGWPVGHSK